MRPDPLVSIVTPCLNATRFLEQTIRSVISQDYSRIEYLVMDGGSTDGTLEILRSHDHELTYISSPDGGTADAINKGFQKARGDVLAWLNADDTYLPGAVSKAVSALIADSEAAAVYGEGYWTGADGEILGRYPSTPPIPSNLAQECCICQPTCFMWRKPLESIGWLNPLLRASFDYDLWIRLAGRYRFRQVPEYLATSRMHRENKTLGQRRTVFTESIALLRHYYRYVPLNWVYGYLSLLRDGRDQFFEPLHFSIVTYLLAFPFGMRYNYAYPVRYGREWLSKINLASLSKLRDKQRL